MRPAREFNVVLRARDKQVSGLQDHNDSLKAQLDSYERRLTNARANAHADARAYQLQERKIEQLRMKLRDVRAASAAQRRELEDARRESEMQREQLAEAQEENIRNLARIAELEEALQAKSSPVPTSDVEDLEIGGVSCDDIMDVLAQVTIDLEEATRMTEEIFSSDQLPHSIPRRAHANRVETGIQAVSGDVSGANQSGDFRWPLQGAEDIDRPVLRTASEDQCRIRELEADLKNVRGLNEELRNAAEEDTRQDRRTITNLEATTDEYQSEIESLEAQVVLYCTLLEESRAFSDDLEESHDSIVACKDAFIEELREKVKELTTSEAWGQQHEASLHDAQEKLAAADIEILELRLDIEGAQRNAVMATNRIIQLEAEASAARHRLQTTGVENGDLREELGVASERVYALEDELVTAQGRLDNAESTIRQLRHEVERYVQTSARIPNSPRIQYDIHDVNDTDSASDEGSIDTLVMDPDEHSLHLSKMKDVDSPSSDQDKQFSHDIAPTSVRDLEARLETMTLKYEAAEAARICGEDVEDILRTKLQALSRVNLCPEKQFSSSTAFAPAKTDPDMRPDSPSEEWHSLPTIPEEDERSTSPTPQRVALPRIQTSSIIAVKNAVSVPVPVTAESPLLPSPTLADIWFSDIRVSLALVEKESSVLDWDLPSPGVDSDSS
jgi:chromosome segregation ATPase